MTDATRMNTYLTCGAVSFGHRFLREAKRRMVRRQRSWKCLALCLGVGVLSAGTTRGFEALPVQSYDDLSTLLSRAALQDRLMVLFFTDLSGKCTNCALME